LENTYLKNGQLENGQLENGPLENEKYSAWSSPEGLFGIWSIPKQLLKINVVAKSVRLSWK